MECTSEFIFVKVRLLTAPGAGSLKEELRFISGGQAYTAVGLPGSSGEAFPVVGDVWHSSFVNVGKEIHTHTLSLWSFTYTSLKILLLNSLPSPFFYSSLQ